MQVNGGVYEAKVVRLFAWNVNTKWFKRDREGTGKWRKKNKQKWKQQQQQNMKRIQSIYWLDVVNVMAVVVVVVVCYKYIFTAELKQYFFICNFLYLALMSLFTFCVVFYVFRLQFYFIFNVWTFSTLTIHNSQHTAQHTPSVI